jgi:RimJ/RimL family protein N-acetyltransferase
MKPVEVVTIEAETGIDDAAATLVLAFSTDPLMRWVFDSPERYLAYGTQLIRFLLTSSCEAGGAQRTDDGSGVACWLPPGVLGDDEPIAAIVQAGAPPAKLAEIGAIMEQLEHHRPTEAHWYLSIVGVDPLHWSQGYGATLLQQRLRQCDEAHLPAYLWASSAQSAALYERHGFEIQATLREGSAPPIFPMLRGAR